MLVLLIVFMVTAPLLTVGVPVDLPKSRAQSIADPDEPLVISVNAEGQIYLQDSEVELSQLVPRQLLHAGSDINARHQHQAGDDARDDTGDEHAADQIGRASCRERVCQYV